MPYSIRVFLKRFLLIFIIYSLLRVFFFCYDFPVFENVNSAQILWAFVVGWRFDLCALLLLNLPFLVLALLPSRWQEPRWFQRIYFYLFVLLNSAFVGLNILDAELYKFTGRRLTIDVLQLRQDISNEGPQLIFYYWPLTLLAIAFVAALVYFYPRWQTRAGEQVKGGWLTIGKHAVWSVLLVLLAVIGARGGLQLKPLSPANAFKNQTASLGTLALNSTFTILKSKTDNQVPQVHFFHDRQQVVDIVTRHPGLVQAAKDAGAGRLAAVPAANASQAGTLKMGSERPNVVVLILESFALEYTGLSNPYKGYTPFLDSLAKKSLFFPHHFANGRRSIVAVPSILCGVPGLMNEPFITSNYQGVSLNCLGNILQRRGYVTAFFHGAENGSMFFDSFSRRAGFSQYFGLNEYPNKKDFDGHWGIFDEPFLQFVDKKLTTFKEPFAATIFTLSSHQPYTIPPQYKGRFPKGTLEIHESIGYADYALKKFFATAQKEPWFNNTIFVLTGDHTQKSDRPRYANTLGHYRVPLIIYSPHLSLPPVDTNRIAQHVDILPSILDALHIKPHRRLFFGHSVFDRSSAGLAYNYTNGGYWLINKNLFVTLHLGGSPHFYTHKGTYDLHAISASGLTPALRSEEQQTLNQIKAYVQYFNNGLVRNNWYYTLWK